MIKLYISDIITHHIRTSIILTNILLDGVSSGPVQQKQLLHTTEKIPNEVVLIDEIRNNTSYVNIVSPNTNVNPADDDFISND